MVDTRAGFVRLRDDRHRAATPRKIEELSSAGPVSDNIGKESACLG
jgi:hypothetical protein